MPTGRATHGTTLIVFGLLLNTPPLAAADGEMTLVFDLHGQVQWEYRRDDRLHKCRNGASRCSAE